MLEIEFFFKKKTKKIQLVLLKRNLKAKIESH